MKMIRNLCTIAILLLIIALISEAVDRGKFKTCQQSSFCRRNRGNGKDFSQDGKNRYKVLANTVQIDTSTKTITADLKDTKWSLRAPLKLSISLHANNVMRMRINEDKPLHRRFEVRDVLTANALQTGSGSIQSFANDNTVLVTFGKNNEFEFVIRVDPEPFSVELRIRGQPTIRANSLGLLNFEPYRDKNPRPAPPAPAEGEPAAAPAQADPATSAHPFDEDGYWEESFGSHRDTKPRGPADVSMDVSFVATKHIYGIPEHASSLTLKTTNGEGHQYQEPYRLYNLDVFEYELNEPMALYGAIPFIMSHTAERSAAILWLNAAETFVDVFDTINHQGQTDKHSHWISESGIIDVFFFVGPTPNDIFFQYASLTGFTALPQQFAIAYHQCRWNYNSQDDVISVDGGFDTHDIPMDVVWLDIEHTDGKKYFTWDRTNFPRPEEMIDALGAKGRKMVTIVDPHIKRDSGYHVHSAAESQGLYVKKSKSAGHGDFEGWCWPGSVSYLDFFQPKVRDFWADQFSLSNYKGSTPNLFTWNDMNEPSVFNGPEVSMHKDCLHGGEEEIEHRDLHNMYGFYQHMATAQGHVKRDNARPFVLTRSFFAGSQRFGAVWTGDNKAAWEHLAAAQPMLMSLGVSGFSFAGADVGGFFGDPSVELLVRWYQAGAFHPFFRGHAHIDTKRREPWLFGEPHTSQIRKAIRTRYAILPYLYTTFHTASVSGAPVMRPLWTEFPGDDATFDMDDQFLLGRDIMVKPVTASGTNSLNVYLPGDESWYDFETFHSFNGKQTVQVSTPMDKIPVFIRAGSIIPRKERPRRASSLMVNDPYTLWVALDSKGTASGMLYVDDGKSFAYQDGDFIHRTLTFQNNQLSSQATSNLSSSSSRFQTNCKVERIVIMGLNTQISKATLQSGTSTVDLVVQQTSNPARLILRKPDAAIDHDFTITLSA